MSDHSHHSGESHPDQDGGGGQSHHGAMAENLVQNLWWASGYNLIAIPLAAGVLASPGVVLSPAAGAVLMSLSTVIVAVNARLLRLPED